jgi:GNAT superfamily N-acetyltransferase
MDATIRPLGAPGDLGWVVLAHGEEYAAEYGWDSTFEALVARIVADYANPAADRTAVDHPRTDRTGAWIAEHNGERVGCVMCMPHDETTAQLRVLLVRRSARGLGLGAALVDTCLDFARDQGYQRMRLWTTDVLDAARRIYLARGFRIVAEEPRRRLFGADLVGQTYELALT